ncbi:uncharacterized protein LOC107043316 [Diachasma alloeum]|uniref:uncharacterized protein LOC107043316 n=1 Tax=Diachasma alloeum TaxID=454923 RepID=UPI00073838E9|nr:uncharacterized protein LOC107043316 [Diachasma alloeum]XP_015120238.1 uncharacterized protein LOC107043316 [Diachasma alloeum]XP_015120239.1 uncharacterized protein LOC107043316 [Diachasma alloeum]XP_015120240.1 uncharacterized protein LOC107043316 [Diachasma alloeum]XP_015120241.1 uncharacterized protein LOC107043316 [Diachasma alloeum]XP_015120242.1 uncharacterized protein LOC107043316 [Diachasma alloeum]XP_015120243.1 uncharacterized protein LOC107043316 [Diachasma alloeum]
MAIARIKSFLDNGLKSVAAPMDRTANLEPEIGIKIVHSPGDKELRVTVVGARHLPQNFGFTRVNSYIVRIKLFPGKDKFETTTKNESWPQWNEEFVFPLRKETKVRFGKSKVTEEQIDGSKLIIATLYAILEDKPLLASEKKEADKENAKKSQDKDLRKKDGSTSGASGSQEAKSNKLLSQFFNKSQDKEEKAAPERRRIDQRRTVGATTIPLDPKNFGTKPARPKHPNDVSTGELWKPLRPIASGISGAEDRRENKKGQVELILIQEKSDKKDVSEGKLVLSLSRLRCSLQTMHEQESMKGQLYIKMSVVEGGRVTHFWKSDRFNPTVSMKFAQDQAQVIADNPYEGALKDVSFVVKFVSKNKMGKKTTIGHFVIGPDVGGQYSDQWKQAMSKPGQAITKWQAFE